MSSKNKFVFLFGILAILLIAISGCSTSKKGELVYTTAEDVMVRMENKETFVVYLGTTTCSFCIKYKTELEKVISKKDVTIYGVMINEGNSQNNQILQERFNLNGTPQTYWIVDGEKVDTLVGYVSSTEVIDWLVENEVIQ